MASTEDIEAKLCAYIEGQLDPADQAEIEKHLEANPQHRALLGDLARTRQLVQELPRETAPDEILEAVQSQLERSALLQDDADDRISSAMRINRWPQIFATAAVLLMTIGLGVVIYFVLPRSGQRADYATVTPPEIATPTTSALDGAVVADNGAPALPAPASPWFDKSAETAPLASVSPEASDASDVFAKAMASDPGAEARREPDGSSAVAPGRKAGLDVGALEKSSGMEKQRAFESLKPGGDIATDSAAFQAAKEQLANADLARKLKESPSGLDDNALFVVVSTDDAKATKSQVAGYLTSNSIRWDAVSQAAPAALPVEESQRALASRQNRMPDYRLKSGPPADAVQRETSAVDEHKDSDRDVAKSIVSKAPATGGAAIGTVGGAQRLSEDRNDFSNAATEAEVSREGGQAGAVALSDRPDELIIARSMTRSQAAALKESLSSQVNVYRAALYDQPVLDGSPRQYFESGAPSGWSLYENLTAMVGNPVALPYGDRSTYGMQQQMRQIEPQQQQQQPANFARTEAAAATSQPAGPATDEADETVDVVIVVKDQPPVTQSLEPLQQAAPAIVPAVPATTTPTSQEPTAVEQQAPSVDATGPVAQPDAANVDPAKAQEPE